MGDKVEYHLLKELLSLKGALNIKYRFLLFETFLKQLYFCFSTSPGIHERQRCSLSVPRSFRSYFGDVEPSGKLLSFAVVKSEQITKTSYSEFLEPRRYIYE